MRKLQRYFRIVDESFNFKGETRRNQKVSGITSNERWREIFVFIYHGTEVFLYFYKLKNT